VFTPYVARLDLVLNNTKQKRVSETHVGNAGSGYRGEGKGVTRCLPTQPRAEQDKTSQTVTDAHGVRWSQTVTYAHGVGANTAQGDTRHS